MNYKEKAWELSKLLAKYADDEENYFTFNRSGLEEAGYKRTSIFPDMQSDLSQWKVSKPWKLDWMKVPINTLVNVRDVIGELPEERHFAIYLPSKTFGIRGKFFTFADGETQVNAKQLVSWKYCELHSSVKIQEGWYEDE